MNRLPALVFGLASACATIAFAQNASVPIELYQAKPVRYRDRMEGIPIHDEQGSHHRPGTWRR